ncbi:MAG: HYR domain-containing protein, partial [Flavobacteriaceae bacterium]
MNKKLFKRLVLALLLFMAIPDLSAHGVQVVYRELPNGFVRVYIEHWHGDLSLSSLSAGDGMNITTLYGATSTTLDVSPSGVVNNTLYASLPGGGTPLTVLGACAGDANTHNDWVYYDFAPPACGVPVTVTLNYGLGATLADACGTMYPSTFSKTYIDVAPPVITSPDVIVDSCVPVSVAYTTTTVVDACDNTPVVVYSIPSGSVFPVGSTPVTVTATDNLGQVSMSVFNVIVGDISAPVPDMVTLTNVNAGCSVTSLVAPTATDNCLSAIVTVTNNAVLPITTSTVVTWTYDDGNGNLSTQTQNVNIVVDTTAPVVTCPADLTIECDADSTPANTGTATATDNCDASPIVTFSDAVTAGVGSNSSIARTWTATDANGNTSNCIQIITVVDTTAPLVTCPADLTIECDADNSPANTGTATATDNC